MKMTTLKTSIAAALFAAVLPAHANLIVNGSFENTPQANGTWAIYQNLPGWTGGAAGIELRNNVAGTAFAGVNYVELDTTRNSLAYQNIATVLGQQYLLSFAYSPRPGVSATSNPIEVLWNNVWLTQVTGTGATNGNNNWVTAQFLVTGSSPFSTLTFRAGGASDSYGGSLDDVSLTSVPEPGSLALLGLGLAGLGFARRKKA